MLNQPDRNAAGEFDVHRLVTVGHADSWFAVGPGTPQRRRRIRRLAALEARPGPGHRPVGLVDDALHAHQVDRFLCVVQGRLGDPVPVSCRLVVIA